MVKDLKREKGSISITSAVDGGGSRRCRWSPAADPGPGPEPARKQAPVLRPEESGLLRNLGRSEASAPEAPDKDPALLMP